MRADLEPIFDNEPDFNKEREQLQKTIDGLVICCLLHGAKLDQKNEPITPAGFFYGEDDITLQLLPHRIVVQLTENPSKRTSYFYDDEENDEPEDNDENFVQKKRTTFDLPLHNVSATITQVELEKANEDGELQWYKLDKIHNNLNKSSEMFLELFNLNYSNIALFLNQFDGRINNQNLKTFTQQEAHMSSPLSSEDIRHTLDFVTQALIHKFQEPVLQPQTFGRVSSEIKVTKYDKLWRMNPEIYFFFEDMYKKDDKWYMRHVSTKLDAEFFVTLLNRLGLPEPEIPEPFFSEEQMGTQLKIRSELSKILDEWIETLRSQYSESEFMELWDTLGAEVIQVLQEGNDAVRGEAHGIIIHTNNKKFEAEAIQQMDTHENGREKQQRKLLFNDQYSSELPDLKDQVTALRILTQHLFGHSG